MRLEGNQPIKLLEPVAGERDRLNQELPATPREHPAWSRRLDIRGRERQDGAIVTGRWPAIFRVRRTAALAALNETWEVRDDIGQIWEIASVLVTADRVWYEIHAFRPKPRKART